MINKANILGKFLKICRVEVTIFPEYPNVARITKNHLLSVRRYFQASDCLRQYAVGCSLENRLTHNLKRQQSPYQQPMNTSLGHYAK